MELYFGVALPWFNIYRERSVGKPSRNASVWLARGLERVSRLERQLKLAMLHFISNIYTQIYVDYAGPAAANLKPPGTRV